MPGITDNTKRVAIYIRVSTQEQATEGYSIGAQTERLQAYCKARDWLIYNIYTDPGFSGSNIQRPAMQQMIADAQANKFDLVLVYKLDRLSRSQKDTLYIIEDIVLKNGLDFVSMSENFDTSTPLGRAMIGILSVFAQLEREQIRERMHMGLVERAKAGLWSGGGFRPFGYDYENSVLTINEYEAAVCRFCYESFLDGKAVTWIAENCNTRYGMHFNHSNVYSILRTPLYAGKIKYSGELYEGKHEPIVSMEDFNRIQEMFHERGKHNNRPIFKSTTLFGSLMFCGNCGAGYFAKGNYSGHKNPKTYRPYYTCYSRGKSNRRVIKDPTCTNPSYAVKDFDAMMIEQIRGLRKYDTLATAMETSRQRTVPRASEQDVLMRRIDNIDHQLNRLLDLYQLGSVSIDMVSERMGKMKEEKATLQKTLTLLQHEEQADDNRLTLYQVNEILSSFDAVMENGTTEEKQDMVRRLIKKIIVLPEKGKLDIHWNF